MTSIRWRILLLLMAYAGLVHFNRISISAAGSEHIMRENGISETQMGFVYSAYLFVYTLCMIPGGWFIDRFGPKRALLVLGFGSALLVPLTGATSLLPAGALLGALCLIRGGLGVVSAPMHPGAARAVSFWMPPPSRGLANGMVTGAAVVGVASTYYVFGFLMDLVGWPLAFLVAGIVTLALAALWMAYATDRPAQHPGVDAAERALIESTAAPPAHGDSDDHAIAPEPLLRNKNLILLTASYAALSYFQYLFFYWMQHYFDEIMHLGKDAGRLYATIPTLAMAVGMMGGGWTADVAHRLCGGPRGRSLVAASGMATSAVFIVVGIVATQPLWVVTSFALAMGALGASEPCFWVTGIELGRQRGGLSAAILNTGGNAGGILAPAITPIISQYVGWQGGLGLASALCLSGAVMWLWIGADPVAPREAV